MKRIATISLESIAPVSLGGYDTSTHRQIGYINLAEPFRLTSVKGIWRWWLRAYLAGAAWDEGLSEKEGAEESQSILGSTQAASLFGFRILSQSSTPLDAYSERKVSENLRVRLLLGVWGRRRLNRDQIDRLRALFRYLKAEFEIYSRKSSTPTTLALGSLITGLKLGGLGKFSRRAFGSFKIHIESQAPEMKNIVEKLEEVETAPETTTVANLLRGLIKITKEEASSYLKNYELGTGKSSRIPAVPSFAGGFHTIHLFAAPSNMDAIDILNEVSKSVTRTASELGKTPTISAALTGGMPAREGRRIVWRRVEEPIAWTLGLPRRVRRTGYTQMWVDKESVSRRASPLIFRLLQERLLAATLFISSDWPDIKWEGGRRPRRRFKIAIDERGDVTVDGRKYALKHLMSDVDKHLINYFRARQYRHVRVI